MLCASACFASEDLELDASVIPMDDGECREEEQTGGRPRAKRDFARVSHVTVTCPPLALGRDDDLRLSGQHVKKRTTLR